MANNQYVNKVVYGAVSIIDITPTTAVESDVAQGKVFFKADGSQATGTASGGGGSSYTLLTTKELTVNTTSTSSQLVDTISCTASDVWTAEKIIYVKIYDKAGPRNGYFYGTENYCINVSAANGQTTGTSSFSVRGILKKNSSGTYEMATGSGYGVFANNVSPTGDITISSRYNSTSSRTINGTYVVEVYVLKWPNNDSPFS